MGRASFTNALGWAIRVIRKHLHLFEEKYKFDAENRLDKLDHRYQRTKSKADEVNEKEER